MTGIIKKRASAGFDEASESSQPQRFNYKPSRDEYASLAAVVTAKIEDGNLRAAIRLLCSDEKMAVDSQSNLEKLQEKHPPAAVDRRPVPRPDPALSLQVTTGDVLKCLRSFPAGSSAGPDGLRPNHLLDLVNCKESGDALLLALTSFTNCILAGSCPSVVIPVFFGGRLIALQKKAGGIQPIAIGYTLRRLVAKCTSTFAITKLENSFAPLQVGVGVPGGCEAAVHATRRFVASMPSGYMVAKLDFSNAFNSLRRDAILETVFRFVPEIYQLCHSAYHAPTDLSFGDHIVRSEEGCQQGDPLGPVLFSLTIQPLLCSLSSELVVGYLDDITLGGPESVVSGDIERVSAASTELGLFLNRRKCEVFHEADYHPTSENLDEFIHFTPAEASLLGTALFADQALDDLLSAKLAELRRVIERLEKISAHDALLMLTSFDALLRDGLCRIAIQAQIVCHCPVTDVLQFQFTRCCLLFRDDQTSVISKFR